MSKAQHLELLKFLQNDLDVSAASLNVALKQWEQDPGPLPIVLWHYGLVSLDQLEKIYDWIDAD